MTETKGHDINYAVIIFIRTDICKQEKQEHNLTGYSGQKKKTDVSEMVIFLFFFIHIKECLSGIFNSHIWISAEILCLYLIGTFKLAFWVDTN